MGDRSADLAGHPFGQVALGVEPGHVGRAVAERHLSGLQPEAAAGRAVRWAAWLKRCMLDAMAPLIEPVPVEVEATAALTWGG
jgi:hypothetical protein